MSSGKIDSSIYKKRNKLYNKSKILRSIALDNKLAMDKTTQIRKQQDSAYKMWYFYDKIIKEVNKLPKEE